MTSPYQKTLKKYTRIAVEFNTRILDGVHAFSELQEACQTEEDLIHCYETYLATAFDPKSENALMEELAAIVNEIIEDARDAERRRIQKIEKKRAKLN